MSVAALCEDVRRGDFAAVKRALGQNPGVLRSSAMPGGRTPLHIAAACGHHHIVRTMLQHGAMYDAKDASGEVPLMAAARQGHLSVLRELLADSGQRATCLMAASKAGSTALHIAAAAGQAEAAQLLLDAGAKADTRDKAGRTPLGVAEAAEHTAVTRVLQHGRILPGTLSPPLSVLTRSPIRGARSPAPSRSGKSTTPRGGRASTSRGGARSGNAGGASTPSPEPSRESVGLSPSPSTTTVTTAAAAASSHEDDTAASAPPAAHASTPEAPTATSPPSAPSHAVVTDAPAATAAADALVCVTPPVAPSAESSGEQTDYSALSLRRSRGGARTSAAGLRSPLRASHTATSPSAEPSSRSSYLFGGPSSSAVPSAGPSAEFSNLTPEPSAPVLTLPLTLAPAPASPAPASPKLASPLGGAAAAVDQEHSEAAGAAAAMPAASSDVPCVDLVASPRPPAPEEHQIFSYWRQQEQRQQQERLQPQEPPRAEQQLGMHQRSVSSEEALPTLSLQQPDLVQMAQAAAEEEGAQQQQGEKQEEEPAAAAEAQTITAEQSSGAMQQREQQSVQAQPLPPVYVHLPEEPQPHYSPKQHSPTEPAAPNHVAAEQSAAAPATSAATAESPNEPAVLPPAPAPLAAEASAQSTRSSEAAASVSTGPATQQQQTGPEAEDSEVLASVQQAPIEAPDVQPLGALAEEQSLESQHEQPQQSDATQCLSPQAITQATVGSEDAAQSVNLQATGGGPESSASSADDGESPLEQRQSEELEQSQQQSEDEQQSNDEQQSEEQQSDAAGTMVVAATAEQQQQGSPSPRKRVAPPPPPQPKPGPPAEEEYGLRPLHNSLRRPRTKGAQREQYVSMKAEEDAVKWSAMAGTLGDVQRRIEQQRERLAAIESAAIAAAERAEARAAAARAALADHAATVDALQESVTAVVAQSRELIRRSGGGGNGGGVRGVAAAGGMAGGGDALDSFMEGVSGCLQLHERRLDELQMLAADGIGTLDNAAQVAELQRATERIEGVVAAMTGTRSPAPSPSPCGGPGAPAPAHACPPAGPPRPGAVAGVPALQAQVAALGAEFDRVKAVIARDMGEVRGQVEAERAEAAEARRAAAAAAELAARREEEARRDMAAKEERVVQMRESSVLGGMARRHLMDQTGLRDLDVKISRLAANQDVASRELGKTEAAVRSILAAVAGRGGAARRARGGRGADAAVAANAAAAAVAASPAGSAAGSPAVASHRRLSRVLEAAFGGSGGSGKGSGVSSGGGADDAAHARDKGSVGGSSAAVATAAQVAPERSRERGLFKFLKRPVSRRQTAA